MLTTEQLLAAYASGFFPMAVNPRGDIRWFSPDPRALIPLDDRFHIPRGLRRVLRKNSFTVTMDKDFDGVINACATSHGKTWISKEILRAYCQLHRDGWAHSVETWQDGKLAGGLYGVHIRGAFFGESMFHRASDASKVALVSLVERLRLRGFTLLDTQWTTPHLRQFGTFEIPGEEYLALLSKAMANDCQLDDNPRAHGHRFP